MSERFTKVNILSVEDNLGDQALIRSYFDSRTKRVHLTFVQDGEEALKRLFKPNGKIDFDLVLLDLNIPGKDGRDVLKDLKESEKMKHIPVIVFSSSSIDEDIIRSYSLGANCYIVKPNDLSEFENVMGQIEKFWLDTVSLAS